MGKRSLETPRSRRRKDIRFIKMDFKVICYEFWR